VNSSDYYFDDDYGVVQIFPNNTRARRTSDRNRRNDIMRNRGRVTVKKRSPDEIARSTRTNESTCLCVPNRRVSTTIHIIVVVPSTASGIRNIITMCGYRPIL